MLWVLFGCPFDEAAIFWGICWGPLFWETPTMRNALESKPATVHHEYAPILCVNIPRPRTDVYIYTHVYTYMHLLCIHALSMSQTKPLSPIVRVPCRKPIV